MADGGDYENNNKIVNGSNMGSSGSNSNNSSGSSNSGRINDLRKEIFYGTYKIYYSIINMSNSNIRTNIFRLCN